MFLSLEVGYRWPEHGTPAPKPHQAMLAAVGLQLVFAGTQLF